MRSFVPCTYLHVASVVQTASVVHEALRLEDEKNRAKTRKEGVMIAARVNGRTITAFKEPGIDAGSARPDQLVGINPTQLKQPSQQKSGREAETPIACQELAPSAWVRATSTRHRKESKRDAFAASQPL
jgi:hypothetical protein